MIEEFIRRKPKSKTNKIKEPYQLANKNSIKNLLSSVLICKLKNKNFSKKPKLKKILKNNLAQKSNNLKFQKKIMLKINNLITVEVNQINKKKYLSLKNHLKLIRTLKINLKKRKKSNPQVKNINKETRKNSKS